MIVRRAFHLLLHKEVLFDLGLTSADSCILALLADMYENLKVELRLPLLANEFTTSLLCDFAFSSRGNSLLSVKKG